jgi:acyl-CoA synthetase (NDP forming)
LNNPIDPTSSTIAMEEGTGIAEILETVQDDPNIDALVVHLNLSTFMSQLLPAKARQIVASTVDCVIRTAKQSVPLILVLRGCGELSIQAVIVEEQQKCLEHGVPVLPSLESALRSLGCLVRRREALSRERDGLSSSGMLATSN